MSTLARWAQTFGLTRAICVLLLFALVPLRILDPLPLEEIRLRTFDLYQNLRPREPVSRPVVIVDIDEKSLKQV
jgi:adenylate cyclase